MIAAALAMCLVFSADRYQVHEDVIQAVMEVEGGTPGLASRNSNGTHDYGRMQINTVWTRQFEKQHGISRSQLTNDDCLSVQGAAYIIRYEINRTGDFWAGVGNYHSRTPKYHDPYLRKVQAAYARIRAAKGAPLF
jgi:hypothetical protein